MLFSLSTLYDHTHFGFTNSIVLSHNSPASHVSLRVCVWWVGGGLLVLLQPPIKLWGYIPLLHISIPAPHIWVASDPHVYMKKELHRIWQRGGRWIQKIIDWGVLLYVMYIVHLLLPTHTRCEIKNILK